jgi:hypothetical protein
LDPVRALRDGGRVGAFFSQLLDLLREEPPIRFRHCEFGRSLVRGLREAESVKVV